MPNLIVVVPTYNEAENIVPFAEALLPILDHHNGCLLFVDDNSPDGSGRLADELAGQYPGHIDVLHRPGKQGLGRAYQAGMHVALDRGAAWIAQMDCDFSHRPADLERLLAARGQQDLIIGSRYVAGGQTANWSPWRRRLSLVGCFYARLVLSVPVMDLSGGFKLWRAQQLAAILPRTSSAGFGFQAETTFLASRNRAMIEELPIVFVERAAGKSKLTAHSGLEGLWRLPSLRFRSKV